jgi:hypothetical protein
MKKCALGVVAVMIISCLSFSCKQQKSLQELLQEEKKAIDRFITMNDLDILREYPKDGVFKDKEFFRTTEGLFIHVVDSGNGTRVQLRDEVCVRFEYLQYIKDAAKGDSTVVSPNPYEPFWFIYGFPQSYSSYYSPVCQAWVMPLAYVGENAILDLIIPSSIGSTTDNSNITPVYYKNLRYTRFN